jgi:hypothetical protein
MPTTPTTLSLMTLCLLAAGCCTERCATGTNGAADFAHVSIAAIQAMQEQAESIKAHGAALVAWVPGEATTGWESRMRVVGTFHSNDQDPANDANLLAIAYTKAAEMADTLKNSGSGVRPKLKGENGYKGGVIRPVAGGYVIAAFSGAKSEDDVVISGKGADVLVAAYGAPVAK